MYSAFGRLSKTMSLEVASASVCNERLERPDDFADGTWIVWNDNKEHNSFISQSWTLVSEHRYRAKCACSPQSLHYEVSLAPCMMFPWRNDITADKSMFADDGEGGGVHTALVITGSGRLQCAISQLDSFITVMSETITTRLLLLYVVSFRKLLIKLFKLSSNTTPPAYSSPPGTLPSARLSPSYVWVGFGAAYI